MRVLLTGSAGWLGRHLYPLLREEGHTPIGLDLAPGPYVDMRGNVADRQLIDGLFEKYEFDGVIHTAALHKPDIERFTQQAFIDVNVTGTLNLLQNASLHSCAQFVFTSTTSLMISEQIRSETHKQAHWLDEDFGPLEPRNIYGVTKLCAEHLCRLEHRYTSLNVIVLRTSRFFPEDDDTIRDMPGLNLKAIELLYRRAAVSDVARAHVAALGESSNEREIRKYIVSAPTPFDRGDLSTLKKDATTVIRTLFPEAEELFASAGWKLPRTIGRVYDGRKFCRDFEFSYKVDFAAVLEALQSGNAVPVDHDPGFVAPIVETQALGIDSDYNVPSRG